MHNALNIETENIPVAIPVKWGDNLLKIAKIRQNIGKTFLGLMNLNFCCDNMKVLLHPILLRLVVVIY